MATDYSISTAFTAINNISAPFRAMSNDVNKFASNAQKATTQASAGFSGLKSVVGGLGIAFGAAQIGMVVSDIVKEMANYDQALADAQAITGTTDAEFAGFEKQIKSVANATKKGGTEIANAFTIVGSAQPELLKSADALGEVTKASIILAKAGGIDLTQSASSLTGVMNQFNLQAKESSRVMNVLAAGEVAGASNIKNTSEAMARFGAVANASNISVEESVALVQIMAKKFVMAGDAGNTLKSTILNLKAAKVGYQSGIFNLGDALDEVSKKAAGYGSQIERDAYLEDVFKKTQISTGLVLLENKDKYSSLTAEITNTSTATDLANKKTNTAAQKFQEVKNQLMNMILFSDNANDGMQIITKTLGFLSDNLGMVVSLVVKLTGAFLAYKAIMFAVNGSIALYNIALGVSVALGKSSMFAMRGNTAAAWAFTIAQKAVAVAQYAWNASMVAFNAIAAMNPIGLIVLGIAAMIAAIALVITYWDDFGAAIAAVGMIVGAFFSPVLAGVALLVSAFMALKNNWDSITTAFQSDGIISGFKRIGLVLLDTLLFPMQQLLEMLSNIPMLGDLAGEGAQRIAEIREKLEFVNPTADKQEADVSRQESIEKQQLEILINNNSDNKVETQSSNIAPTFTPTFGF